MFKKGLYVLGELPSPAVIGQGGGGVSLVVAVGSSPSSSYDYNFLWIWMELMGGLVRS